MRLRTKLGLLVASVGASGCSSGESSDDDKCPYSVVRRTADVELASAEACTLISTQYQIYGQGDRGGASTACQAYCNDAKMNQCRLPAEYEARYSQALQDAGAPGGDGGAQAPCSSWTDPPTVVLTCYEVEFGGKWHSGCPVEGRRPEGLDAPSQAAASSALGAYFAACAHLEAAAVVAFRSLHAELARFGAPVDLLAGIRAAEADEIRHAELAGRLATRFEGSISPVRVVDVPARTLEQVARENVVEGLVRETFGAAVALFRASRARDEEVRSILAEIAEDECVHAELSWRIADWARTQLDEGAWMRLETAMREAIADLERETIREPAGELQALAGVPSAEQCRALLDGLKRDVWFRA